MQNKNFYAGADFPGALEKMISKIHLFTLLCRTRASMPASFSSENYKNQFENYLFKRLGWPEPSRKMDLQDPFLAEVQATLTNETSTFHEEQIR